MNRSPALTTGLSIAVLLGVLDIAGLAGLFADPGPPAAVAPAYVTRPVDTHGHGKEGST